MGDLSETRILVVIASFIGLMILLLGWMPAYFVNPTPYTGRSLTSTIPSSWESGMLIGGNFAANKTQMLNDTGMHTYGVFIYDMSFGGHSFRMIDAEATRSLIIQHYSLWGGFIPVDYHDMNWISPNGTELGTELTEGKIDSSYLASNVTGFKIYCEHTYFYAQFSFDFMAYSAISDAWDANALTISLGMTFDQLGTTLGAWTLITGILFFNLPMINPYLNAIIAIPIWICIAYVSFILVLRAIGAVFGGGGA